MKLTSLTELLHDQLKDLASAESQISKALPKMAKAAHSPELRDAFAAHLEETRGQIERLEQIAGLLGVKLKGKKCAAMEGLIAEGKEILEEADKGPIRDLALIAAAQRVEHYEISAYGSARALAERIGLTEVAGLLNQTLEQESATDEKLTGIAQKSILPDESLPIEPIVAVVPAKAKEAKKSSRSKNGKKSD